jgi:hypothetical protein
MLTRSLAGLMSVSLLWWSSPAALESQKRPDLTGAWKLNPGLTAQAGQRNIEERAAIAGRRAPLGGGPVGGGSGSGRGPIDGFSGGGRQSPEDSAKAREAMRLATIASDRLTISREDNGVLLTDAGGASQKWTLDGRTSKSQIGALTVETRARWDDEILVVERKFEGGVKVTDRYSVSGIPPRLAIASKIEGKNIDDRMLHRVYDMMK